MGCLYLLLMLIPVFGFPMFLLRPIIAKAKACEVQIKARFTILDLLSFVFLIQISIGMVSATNFGRIYGVIAACICIFAAFVIWLTGIRAANHLGIEDNKKRLLAVGVAFPAAITGGFAFPILIVLAIRATWTSLDNDSMNNFGIGWPIFLLALFLVLTFLLQRAIKWIASEPDQKKEVDTGLGSIAER